MPNEARDGRGNGIHTRANVEVVLVAASATRRLELRNALTSRARVKGEFSSVVSLVESAQIASAVVVVDFPGRRSREVQDRERESLEAVLENPALSAVVLVENVERVPLAALFKIGNLALLASDASPAELEAAIIASAAGLITIDPEIARHIAERLPNEFPGTRESVEELTPREIEVLRLLARGFGNKQIGARLGISEHTAKFHISSILGKLVASSRTEAVTEGLRRGLILL